MALFLRPPITIRRYFQRPQRSVWTARIGDVAAIIELLDDDILIDFYGPPVIPYAGTYRGTGQARRFFKTVLLSVRIKQFEPQARLATGDKVIVTGHLNLNAVTTGREIDADFVHVITLRNNKWLRFRYFMNTFVAVQAFGQTIGLKPELAGARACSQVAAVRVQELFRGFLAY